MHHPPLLTGVAVWDAMGLAQSDRHALGAVIERHPQVRRLVGGHFHRAITAELAGRAVLAVPSTYAQFQLGFTPEEIELSTEPASFVLHAVMDGDLISHFQPVQP